MKSDLWPRLLLSATLHVACIAPAWSQAPFYTDDTGVTDSGALHVEASDEIDALQSMQYPNLRQNTANLKINAGLPGGLEFDVDVPYLRIDRSTGSRSSSGIGDTNLGLKWQVREPALRAPGFAVSVYVELPTGDVREELGSGETDYWVNFITQLPVSAMTRFNVNVGILVAGNTSTGVVGIETTRGRVYTGGLSLVHDVDSRLTVGAEVYGGIADDPGLDRTQLQAMLAAQYQINERITVYAGMVAGLYTASPRLGAQLGFAFDFPAVFQKWLRGR